MVQHSLDGLWHYSSYELGGKARSPADVARMANLLLMPGNDIAGWDGLYAVVTYGYEGGTWTEAQVRSACRHIILGGDPQPKSPATDLYQWAGGRFRASPDKAPAEIDFVQFWGGEVPPSVNLGLYRLDGDRLILCLADAGNPRLAAFTSDGHPYQALRVLVRGPNR